MRNGRWLKSVQLVEYPIDWSVCDEMVDIIIFGNQSLGFVDER